MQTHTQASSFDFVGAGFVPVEWAGMSQGVNDRLMKIKDEEGSLVARLRYEAPEFGPYRERYFVTGESPPAVFVVDGKKWWFNPKPDHELPGRLVEADFLHIRM